MTGEAERIGLAGHLAVAFNAAVLLYLLAGWTAAYVDYVGPASAGRLFYLRCAVIVVAFGALFVRHPTAPHIAGACQLTLAGTAVAPLAVFSLWPLTGLDVGSFLAAALPQTTTIVALTVGALLVVLAWPSARRQLGAQ